MRQNALTLTAVLLASPMPTAVVAQEAQPLTTSGRIDAVTVYRGQALISRVIDVPGPAGLQEIVVTDLPAHIVPGSLYAESTDGVQVRSVRYRTQPVMKDVRDDVRDLDQQIRTTQDEIARRRHDLAQLQQRAEYLTKLEQFTAETATRELGQSVLDPAKLKEMTAFLFEQRSSIAEKELTLNREIRDLEETLALLQQERQQLTSGSQTIAREAVLFLNVADNDGGPVQLRYLVNNATWTPSYNLRAEEDSDHLIVEYSASIQQMSGENWENVAMHLSTATPTLVSMSPELRSLPIALVAQLPQAATAAYADAGKVIQDLRARREEVEAIRNRADLVAGEGGQLADEIRGVYFARKNAEFDASLNEIALQQQVLELAAEKAFAFSKDLPDSSAQPEEGLSITYAIAGRTTMPSRSDRQFIQIASIVMDAEFYRLATPVLTSAVFEQAKVTNRSDLVLLEGPAASYMNGRFVGHGHVPTVAVGEDFTAGFGIDSSLRAERELADRAEHIQGGNKIVTLTYRLMVNNFADDATTVRITDRMPVSQDPAIKIELAFTSHELRDSKTRAKDGLLSWDIDVAAKTDGDPVVVEYTIRLEYDKQMQISGL